MSVALLRRSRKSPAQFRELLQSLGPTFIKMGQYLAQRPDLVPQEYCDELIKLLDRVPSFPWSEAKEIIKEELGDDPAEVFAHINFRPVAAGSLAQVHLARLHDGTEVAVKIQRPNIREKVLRDLSRVRLIARVLELSGATLVLSPREVIQELTEWMMEELDLPHELNNMRRLYRLTAGTRIQRVPRGYRDFSTERVLTAEYLRGVPVTEVLVTLRSRNDRDSLPGFMRSIDIERFAENMLTATLTQVIKYRFFHADLHPGNLLILPHNVVGYVDFGLCDDLDDRVAENQLNIVSAVYSGEMDRIFKALTEILVPGEATDMERFRIDFVHETRSLESGTQSREKARNSPRETERSPMAQYLIGLMRAARRNHLQVPARVLSMYRALLTAETVAYQLGTSDGLRRAGRSFFAQFQRDEVVEELSDPTNFEPTLLSLLNLKRDAPRQINQVLTELTEGNLNLKVRTSEAPSDSLARNRRAGLMTVSILTVSLALLLTVPQLPSFFGVSLSWPLTILLVLLYIWVLIRWNHL